MVNHAMDAHTILLTETRLLNLKQVRKMKENDDIHPRNLSFFSGFRGPILQNG